MAYVLHRPQQQPDAMSPPEPDTPPRPRPQSRHLELHPPPFHPHQPPSSRHPPPLSKSPNPRRHSLPFFTFPHLSQPNTSSISLVPSTAEGKPIPLDDATTADRTSALRELNRSQPSARHRYTKSSGAPSTATTTTTGTYSQPVIVRTYSGPPPSSTGSRPASRRIPLSPASVIPNTSNWRPGRNGMVLSMARHQGHKKSQRGEDAKLPPLEAFSFKSIMADIQQDIGADLDRIAEICARSKYSLSNQYEVHVAPHGSGASFLASAPSSSRNHVAGGPTLQAISSDDERSSTRHKKRRSGPRRRSAAYGTLETIMSSSRSSEEDKSKKKSAQELADDVRGRTSRHPNTESSTSQSGTGQSQDGKKVARKKSTSFATAMLDTASPRASGNALVSEPAKPKTSRSHLEIRTAQEDLAAENYTHEPPGEPSQPVVSDSVAAAAIASPDEPRSSSGLLSGLSSWIPWRGGSSVTEVASSEQKGGRGKSYAEGSLRHLLKSTDGSIGPVDVKGKGVGR
ncbi:hypothetical protein JX265_013375 [Neoarthrinium moseri]|uniref:Uncharacterized protein n=1 Tax=Neoarthrinium moseri TaxID=1658444 RepID=A0A9Q0AIP8_9PEZI|nr:uncharacterized protein JN550_012189 [Neoarthrinium moseri]KAI1850812.1 hypothetical protein JX265_013375 [Neoarthrinium moseri]KAI1859176.1 hypothetical protein JN550_012189 [Neoarthrinium moseri]